MTGAEFDCTEDELCAALVAWEAFADEAGYVPTLERFVQDFVLDARSRNLEIISELEGS